MITKEHRYLGKKYKVGGKFKDAKHQEWAASPVRAYGEKAKLKDKSSK